MGAFSAFKDKRRANKKRETPTVGSHYLKLARRSALIRYLCIIFAVVFAVYSLSFHASEISMENFRYMLKFINLGDEQETAAGTKLSFDGADGNRGLIFKGDLAVLNQNGLTITGWDGEIILREAFSSDHPKFAENGNGLFCYDIGGRELRIFNSYSRISTISFDYPIYCLSASEDGGFAVASADKGYRGAVYVYDKEFRQIHSRLSGDKYIDFLDLSEDGSEYISAAHHSKGGNIVTHLSRTNVSEGNVTFEQSFQGEIPLGVHFIENGYCLMTSDRVRLFDNDNNLTGEIDFGSKKLLSGKVLDNRILLTYAMEGLSGGTETIIYNTNAEVTFDHNFPAAVSDSMIIGNSYYALTPGVLSVFDLETDEEIAYTVPTSYSSLINNDETLILFSENQAEVFSSDSFEIKEDN